MTEARYRKRFNGCQGIIKVARRIDLRSLSAGYRLSLGITVCIATAFP